MAWRTTTNVTVAARIDVGRTYAGILSGAIDDDGRRGVAA